MRRKIYLNCVLRNNLGDDLFVKTLCNRYRTSDFVALNPEKSQPIVGIDNLKLVNINRKIYKLLKIACGKLGKRCVIDTMLMKKTNTVISLGGSMFMEPKDGDKSLEQWYRGIKKDYYIIGSNIGPIYTKKYLQSVKENVFDGAKDISLRDSRSVVLANNKKARFSPDIIWGLNYDKFLHAKARRAVVSVINCDRKSSQMHSWDSQKYRHSIISIIEELQKKNYEIVLMSFCKMEKDEDEIGQILKELKNKEKVSTYFYENDTDEALAIIGSAELIVGARFHANVIGFAMGKKVIPIIYNDKTRNLLEDISFRGEFIDIEKNIYPETEKLLNNKPMKKDQIDYLKKNSSGHFTILDRILKNTTSK